MATIIPKTQNSNISLNTKNSLILREFKIPVGMYYHKININSSNVITHYGKQISSSDVETITTTQYSSLPNTGSTARPSVSSANKVNDETLTTNISTHNSSANLINCTLLNLNSCKIKTDIVL